MQVWRNLEEIPSEFVPSVVTIGNFDGVHRGHQELISEVVSQARNRRARSVVVTFDPHPAEVHRPELPIKRLTGLKDRMEAFERLGVDAVLLIHYDLEFAQTTPEDFIRFYLAEPLHMELLVVGRDIHFGWRNTGDLFTMEEAGRRWGFDVEVFEDRGGQAKHHRWSSSWARELIQQGDVAGAERILGRPHTVRGTVVRGAGRGRELGFPTANLSDGLAEMLPADGVYAGYLRQVDLPQDAPDRVLPAAISVGTNPTFGDSGRRAEAYVLGRTDLDLYGKEVVVEFVARLRATLTFDSGEALIEQMHEDVKATAAALAADEVGRLAK